MIRKLLKIHQWLAAFVPVFMVTLSTGCAMNRASDTKTAGAEKLKKKVDQLERKINSLERENGRLTAKLQRMNEEVTILSDRIDGTRGFVQRYIQNRNLGARPSPNQNQADSGRAQSDVQMRRISLGNDGSKPQPPSQSDNKATESETATESQSAGSSKGGSSNNSVTITQQDYENHVEDTGGQRVISQQTDPSDSSEQTKRDNKSPRIKPPTEQQIAELDKDQKQREASRSHKDNVDQKNESPENTKKPDDSQSDSLQKDAKNEIDTDLAPKKLYKKGRELYLSRKFDRAQSYFEHFLNANPSVEYRDNALYWIGECHYGRKNYDKAISLFKRIPEEYPNGNKVPDALVKMALAYRQLGQMDEWEQKLKKVVENHSDAPASKKAKKMLDESPNS